MLMKGENFGELFFITSTEIYYIVQGLIFSLNKIVSN